MLHSDNVGSNQALSLLRPHNMPWMHQDIQVKTSLVGAVPQTILSQEVKALAQVT